MTTPAEILSEEDLAALEAAGFTVVPRVPSVEMVESGIAAANSIGFAMTGRPEDAVTAIWSNMWWRYHNP